MTNTENSIFSKAMNPYIQCLIVLVAFLVIMVLARLCVTCGISVKDITMPWTLAATSLLFFVIFNSVFSLSAKDDNSYWTKSFFSFAAFAILSGAIAYFVAGISLEEIGPYRWIYIVITFVYLVFISIIGFLKKIVAFAQREEWTKPMRRSKKR